MKIIHLLKHSYQRNGHVHVAVDLACTQADDDHQVMFVSSGGSFDSLLTSHGVQVITIPELGGLKAVILSAKYLLRATRAFRPDIIHAHMMSSAVLGFGLSKLLRSRLVTTMHNSFDSHSRLMRLGKVVVAVSEAERQLLISRGYRRRKVVAVMNGVVNSPRLDLSRDDIGHLARPCVITLSGLHPRKAVGDVISAFGEISSEFTQWHLNIVGSGDDRERLGRMVDDLRLGNRIHFMGPAMTPQPLLEKADIFATASLAEPCGLNVIEARAAGCAIIGTSVGGIPEVLEGGRAGQLVPPADPQAMAVVFRELMSDPHKLVTWQTRAKSGIEHFTVERMSKDYVRVYETLLTKSTRAKGSDTGNTA